MGTDYRIYTATASLDLDVAGQEASEEMVGEDDYDDGDEEQAKLWWTH